MAVWLKFVEKSGKQTVLAIESPHSSIPAAATRVGRMMCRKLMTDGAEDVTDNE